MLYARLDQELHLNGGEPPRGDLVQHLMAETLSFPPVRGLKPQASHHTAVGCSSCLAKLVRRDGMPVRV